MRVSTCVCMYLRVYECLKCKHNNDDNDDDDDDDDDDGDY